MLSHALDAWEQGSMVEVGEASRVVICGGPRTGKTTLSKRYTCDVVHTDRMIGKTTWSSISDHLADWMLRPGPWVVEGVAAVRALRKLLEANPGQKPCDLVIWCRTPKVPLTSKQAAMMKGTERTWREVRAILRQLQVEIVYA